MVLYGLLKTLAQLVAFMLPRVRIAVYPGYRSLLLGFETRIFLKFRNREGNMREDAPRSDSQSRHVSSDAGRIRACYNADIRDENTVPVG